MLKIKALSLLRFPKNKNILDFNYYKIILNKFSLLEILKLKKFWNFQFEKKKKN